MVIGGTIVTTDNIIVEITAEAGKSYLDEMVGLIQNATRPKTQNEIALIITFSWFISYFYYRNWNFVVFRLLLGYNTDIATLVALIGRINAYYYWRFPSSDWCGRYY